MAEVEKQMEDNALRVEKSENSQELKGTEKNEQHEDTEKHTLDKTGDKAIPDKATPDKIDDSNSDPTDLGKKRVLAADEANEANETNETNEDSAKKSKLAHPDEEKKPEKDVEKDVEKDSDDSDDDDEKPGEKPEEKPDVAMPIKKVHTAVLNTLCIQQKMAELKPNGMDLVLFKMITDVEGMEAKFVTYNEIKERATKLIACVKADEEKNPN